ncbi:MAG: hypothetical protein ABIU63_05610 [Chitinophagaceae bacterium]
MKTDLGAKLLIISRPSKDRIDAADVSLLQYFHEGTIYHRAAAIAQ